MHVSVLVKQTNQTVDYKMLKLYYIIYLFMFLYIFIWYFICVSLGVRHSSQRLHVSLIIWGQY